MDLVFSKKVLAGVFTIILGLLLMGFEVVDTLVAMTLINFGMVMAIVGLRLWRENESRPHDERTRKIGALAASYSWQLTFVTVALLVWVIEYGWLGQLSAQSVVGIVLFEMAFSMLVFRWYFGRREI